VSRRGAIIVLLVIILILILMIWKKNQEFSMEELMQQTSQIDVSEVTDSTLIQENAIDDESGIEVLEGNYTEYSSEYDIPQESIETVTYKVKRGDSLDKITRAFHTTVEAIKYNNPSLKGRNQLSQGETLLIIKDNVIAYKVGKGESLFSIARKFGTSVGQIQDLNQSSSSEIQSGSTLYVPIENFNLLKVIGVEPITTVIRKSIEKNITFPNQKSSKKSPVKMTSNKTFWPVNWEGVTSSYGVRFHPVLGRYIKHKGIDLRAQVGDKVYAFDSGRVTFSGYMSGYGNLIVITHSGGLETRYGHLDKIYATQGESVKKGSVIGSAGATGRVTGPHLHFEVRNGGNDINPMKYIKTSKVV